MRRAVVSAYVSYARPPTRRTPQQHWTMAKKLGGGAKNPSAYGAQAIASTSRSRARRLRRAAWVVAAAPPKALLLLLLLQRGGEGEGGRGGGRRHGEPGRSGIPKYALSPLSAETIPSRRRTRSCQAATNRTRSSMEDHSDSTMTAGGRGRARARARARAGGGGGGRARARARARAGGGGRRRGRARPAQEDDEAAAALATGQSPPSPRNDDEEEEAAAAAPAEPPAAQGDAPAKRQRRGETSSSEYEHDEPPIYKLKWDGRRWLGLIKNGLEWERLTAAWVRRELWRSRRLPPEARRHAGLDQDGTAGSGADAARGGCGRRRRRRRSVRALPARMASRIHAMSPGEVFRHSTRPVPLYRASPSRAISAMHRLRPRKRVPVPRPRAARRSPRVRSGGDLGGLGAGGGAAP